MSEISHFLLLSHMMKPSAASRCWSRIYLTYPSYPALSASMKIMSNFPLNGLRLQSRSLDESNPIVEAILVEGSPRSLNHFGIELQSNYLSLGGHRALVPRKSTVSSEAADFKNYIALVLGLRKGTIRVSYHAWLAGAPLGISWLHPEVEMTSYGTFRCESKSSPIPPSCLRECRLQ